MQGPSCRSTSMVQISHAHAHSECTPHTAAACSGGPWAEEAPHSPAACMDDAPPKSMPPPGCMYTVVKPPGIALPLAVGRPYTAVTGRQTRCGWMSASYGPAPPNN